MPALTISAYTLQKEGTEPRQCEDAFAYDARAGRAALTDGASDAFEAGAWARLLAAMFVHAPPEAGPEAFLDWVHAPARAWHASLRWDELPWYADQKARQVGGLATFLGFYFDAAPEDDEDGPAAWRALAVGDACLLHLRARSVLARFPVERPDGFGTTPALLSTRPAHNQAMVQAGGLQTTDGRCHPGDLFLLATDALAEWFYRLPDLADAGIDLPDWQTLSGLLENDFAAVVEQLRARSVIRNDDVTLLVLRVGEAA